MEKISRFLPPLLVMFVIFWWSEQTKLPGSQADYFVWWDFILKKLAHMIEYALLFFTVSRAINWKKSLEEHSYRYVFLFVLLYAFSDEIHQSFTPGRGPKFVDIGYDLLGGLLIYLRNNKFV